MSNMLNLKRGDVDVTEIDLTGVTGDVTVNSSAVSAIAAGVIVNADVNASAAIVGSKLAAKARKHTIVSPEQNVDNGAGTTVDYVIMRPASAITITAARVVYTQEAAGTIAGANVKLGTALAGEEIVAAAALTDSAAVGDAQALTIVSGAVSAGTPIFMRHTGIAATAAGVYHVELDYTVDD